MAVYIAFLQTDEISGERPEVELESACDAAGFTDIRPYGASGNIVFKSKQTPMQVKAALESALAKNTGRKTSVVVRRMEELMEVIANNPFSSAEAGRTSVIFMDYPLPEDALDKMSGQKDNIKLGTYEIYIRSEEAAFRPDISAADKGAARDMNTISKLARLAALVAHRT